jgi:hypothetical protein
MPTLNAADLRGDSTGSAEAIVRQLVSDSHAYETHLDHLHEVEVALLRVVVDEGDPSLLGAEKAKAMKMLGVYRSTRASRYLAAQFDFVVQGWRAEDDPLNPYPAARAIQSIGRPAIDELVHSCSAWGSEQQFHLAAWILKDYYRSEQDVGLYRLKRAVENAENGKHVDQAYVRNLKRLIAKYEWVDTHNLAHDPKPPTEVE